MCRLRYGIDAQRVAFNIRIVRQNVDDDRFVLVDLDGIRNGFRRIVHRQNVYRNVGLVACAVFIHYDIGKRNVALEAVKITVRRNKHLAAGKVFNRAVDCVFDRHDLRFAIFNVRIVCG